MQAIHPLANLSAAYSPLHNSTGLPNADFETSLFGVQNRLLYLTSALPIATLESHQLRHITALVDDAVSDVYYYYNYSNVLLVSFPLP